MAEQTASPAPAPVTDRRVPPRGVLPRGIQTWLMAGLAGAIVLIILVAGKPNPSTRPAVVATTSQQPPTADRLRDYQDRLRVLDARAAEEARSAANQALATTGTNYPYDLQPQPSTDPIAADRKRREYESLFASNVVLSRRPDSDRPDAGRSSSAAAEATAPATATAPPSIDEIADATIRATLRVNQAPVASAGAAQALEGSGTPSALTPATRTTPGATELISAAGPTQRLLEGTYIDAVLTNRLDGAATAPVNCLVTNPVYSHSGQDIVIPAGARLLGETTPVQAFGENRLAVAFHRLVMPNGRTYSLDRFTGVNALGDAGLRDQVNQHYWSTFGASGAVGLVSGLAQLVGTAGLAGGDGDRTVIIAGNAAGGTAQATSQVMNRFLNRLPTVTIREGHRLKVYLTSDLELPAYGSAARK